jgi:hypothetical protein
VLLTPEKDFSRVSFPPPNKNKRCKQRSQNIEQRGAAPSSSSSSSSSLLSLVVVFITSSALPPLIDTHTHTHNNISIMMQAQQQAGDQQYGEAGAEEEDQEVGCCILCTRAMLLCLFLSACFTHSLSFLILFQTNCTTDGSSLSNLGSPSGAWDCRE